MNHKTDMQAPTEEQIVAAARALANHNADTCNVNREDNWMIYGDSFSESAEIALKAALASRPDAQADERGAHLSRTAGGHGIHGVPRAAFVPHTDSDRTDHCGSCGAENSPQTDDECPVCGAQNVLVSTWGNLQHDRYRNGLRYANNGPQWWEDGPQGDERGAVAELVKCSDMKGAQWYDIKVFDRTLPHGTKLYARAAAPQAEAAQGMPEGKK